MPTRRENSREVFATLFRIAFTRPAVSDGAYGDRDFASLPGDRFAHSLQQRIAEWRFGFSLWASSTAAPRANVNPGETSKGLQFVDKFVNPIAMRNTRPISWLKAARRDFEGFPAAVQTEARRALTVAAEGGKADKAKPFQGFDGGLFEIALRHRVTHSGCSTASRSAMTFG